MLIARNIWIYISQWQVADLRRPDLRIFDIRDSAYELHAGKMAPFFDEAVNDPVRNQINCWIQLRQVILIDCYALTNISSIIVHPHTEKNRNP